MVSIEEIRKVKVLEMAVFDLVGTYIIALLFHAIMWNNPINSEKFERSNFTGQYFVSSLFIYVTFIGIGSLVHYVMGVDSKLLNYLGYNMKQKK